jgi:hypothetical protein
MSTLPIREKPKRINENREKVFPISFPSNSLERKATTNTQNFTPENFELERSGLRKHFTFEFFFHSLFLSRGVSKLLLRNSLMDRNLFASHQNKQQCC